MALAAVLGTALGFTSIGAAYAAGPADGGQNGVNAQSNKASATGTGTSAPDLEWMTTLGDGIVQPGSTDEELTFDSAGHVLFQGENEAADPSVEVLIAVNRDDGTEAWRKDGISRQCGVAASDDGIIYALSNQPTGGESVLALDAKTGDLVGTYDPTLVNDPEMGMCLESLRLAPDGTLLVLSSYDFEHRLHALDTDAVKSGGGFETLWTREYEAVDENGVIVDNRVAATTRPIVSADGGAVYMCYYVPEELRPETSLFELRFHKLDLTTGDVIDDIHLGEHASCNARGMLAVEGGAILDTRVAPAAGGVENQYNHFVMRIDDSGDALDMGWNVLYARDDAVDESGISEWPGGWMSLSGDTVVLGGIHTGVDPDTGARLWVYDAGINADDSLPVDSQGNLYIRQGGGVESIDASGNERFDVTNMEFFDDSDTRLSNGLTVGPEDGLFSFVTVPGKGATIAKIGQAPTQRLSGANRYATAAEIATATFSPADVDTVYLAVGNTFPDGLAGGPLAVSGNDPVLLTGTRSLPAETADALEALSPDRVVALGGKAAISRRVLQDAGAAAGASETDRIAGSNRYETAAAIAGHLPASDVVYLAVGNNFPDSLAGGAATDGAPILLTAPTSLPVATAAWLTEHRPDRVVALGGTAAIPRSVLKQAEAAAEAPGPTAAGPVETDRIAGNSRYATAVAIAETLFAARRLNFDTVYVAVGSNFPDSLSASSAAAEEGAPLLLTKTDALPEVLGHYLDSVEGLERIVVLGGTNAVSAGVMTELRELID